MFSNLSSNSISLATVTPSLVIRGAPNPLSNTTLRPFGPSVTFTAAARMSMPRSIFVRASPENLTSLADMDASLTCPVAGIPFPVLPTREQHNADCNRGQDQPERRNRARPVSIALVKAEQLDAHQGHFVVDTTIIKVRSVNEATDRTVSLPVPTAMTASDMVTVICFTCIASAPSASLGAPATELRGSFKKNPKRKLDRRKKTFATVSLRKRKSKNPSRTSEMCHNQTHAPQQ